MSSLVIPDTPGSLHVCPGSCSRSLIFDDFWWISGLCLFYDFWYISGVTSQWRRVLRTPSPSARGSAPSFTRFPIVRSTLLQGTHWCEALSSGGHISEIRGSSRNAGNDLFLPSLHLSDCIQMYNSRHQLWCEALSSRGHNSEIRGSSRIYGEHPFPSVFPLSNRIQMMHSRHLPS